jgi:hypothetical protein
MLSEAYEGEAMKRSSILSGINVSKKAHMSKLQIKTMLITFFDVRALFTVKSIHEAK